MRHILQVKALLLCTVVMGFMLAPAAAKNYPKSTDRTVVYFGAPW